MSARLAVNTRWGSTSLLLLVTFWLAMPLRAAEVPFHRATVVEVRNAGNYTYLEVEEAQERYWIGLPHTMVPKGSVITFDEQVWMYDFPSKVLGRTFDRVLFVGDVTIESSPEAAPPVSPADARAADRRDGSGGSAGRLPIAEVHRRKADLEGMQVSVTGEVVKILDKIMGSSWIHIEDDSSETSNHLVVRVSERNVEVGAAVTATGVLGVDVDYGYGYFYPVIIEDARITTTP